MDGCIKKFNEKNRWMVKWTGKNRRMVGGIEKWLAGWIDIIDGSLDGQEKIERWLDGYKNGRMDRKNRCMVRWIHNFNVWIEKNR